MGDVETRFDIQPVSDGGAASEELGDAGSEGEAPCVNLFWKIYTATESGEAGGLTLFHAEVSIPVSSHSIKDPNVKAARSKSSAAGNITAWVPYLTNLEELRRGDALWCRVK